MEGEWNKWLDLDYGMILDNLLYLLIIENKVVVHLLVHIYTFLSSTLHGLWMTPYHALFWGFLLLMMITFLGTHRLPKPQAFESRQKKFIKKLCGSCAHATKVNGSLLTWVMTFEKKFLYTKIVPKYLLF